MDDTKIQNGGQLIGRVAPSTSLLIESLIQQLCTMFERDTARRSKLYYAICDRLHEMKLLDGSYNKMEFEAMRAQYQVALYKLVTVARALSGSESVLQVPNCLIAEWSRYRREFNEIGFIASGGFGSVFKAQHRLDGNEYAIKKIVVRSGRVKTIMKHLEEVKTIAKLNHTNIVSYKGAWIESTYPITFVSSLPMFDNSDNEKWSVNIDSHIIDSQSSRFREKIHENVCSTESSSADLTGHNNSPSESGIMTFKNDNIIGEEISERLSYLIDKEEISDIVSFRSEARENSPRDDFNEIETYSSKMIDEINYADNLDDSDSSEKQLCKFDSPSQYATLYIQMTLCDQTLRQWMDKRIEATPLKTVTSILTQILRGLEYIHSLGIVHHDVKPSNIFISNSGNLQVQLGDFGLACPLQRDGHHSMVGTPTYAAPEQLNGICEPKSDIYSLGIVLLELLLPMQTCMERSRVITALKLGEIPTELTIDYPQWAHLISQLIQENPKNRLSPKELLKLMSEDKDTVIARLNEEMAKNRDTIEKLQTIIVKTKEEDSKKEEVIEKLSFMIKKSNEENEKKKAIIKKQKDQIAKLEALIVKHKISLEYT